MKPDVLKSTRYVIENSELVKINKEKIRGLTQGWGRKKIEIPIWNYEYHFFDDCWRTCEYLFILDSLNFCYWTKDPKKKWRIEYKGKKFLSGYFALAFSLKKAVEQGLIRFDPSFILEMSYSDFRKIFQGEGHLLFLKKRFEILKENYSILDEKYKGRFVNLIDRCDGDAIKLVSEIAENFPSFRDETIYRGKKIYFYKRAQILAGDLYATFKGKKWGRFKNLDALTAFADYKIPQILRGYGILEYKDSLAKKVDSKKLIPQGSKEEIEIRASAVWAVEFLKEELNKLGIKLRSFEIDWILWNKAQKEGIKLRPYHLTGTIYY